LIDKIPIAISACLLGHKVRYDARAKKHQAIVDVLLHRYAHKVDIIPFCPEMAIGLGVPRDKIQLVKFKNGQIRLLGVHNHTLDVTDELKSYANQFLAHYASIKHFIVKAKSPSCGYRSSPLFIEQSHFGQAGNAIMQQHHELGAGLFVRTITMLKPELIVIEESELDSEQACVQFLQDLI